LLVRAALALKQVAHIGEGAPITQFAHIQDVADLHLLLMDRALAGEKVWEGPEGLYFAATETYTHKQFAEAVAKSLHKRGLIRTGEVRPYTEEEIKDFLGPFAYFSFGSNCA
jgi:nucleoside-diphosphate-sugar epimerase